MKLRFEIEGRIMSFCLLSDLRSKEGWWSCSCLCRASLTRVSSPAVALRLWWAGPTLCWAATRLQASAWVACSPPEACCPARCPGRCLRPLLQVRMLGIITSTAGSARWCKNATGRVSVIKAFPSLFHQVSCPEAFCVKGFHFRNLWSLGIWIENHLASTICEGTW